MKELMKEFEFKKYKAPSGWMLVLNYYRIIELFKSISVLFESLF